MSARESSTRSLAWRGEGVLIVAGFDQQAAERVAERTAGLEREVGID